MSDPTYIRFLGVKLLYEHVVHLSLTPKYILYNFHSEIKKIVRYALL